jgi:hypothetical protein
MCVSTARHARVVSEVAACVNWYRPFGANGDVKDAVVPLRRVITFYFIHGMWLQAGGWVGVAHAT